MGPRDRVVAEQVGGNLAKIATFFREFSRGKSIWIISRPFSSRTLKVVSGKVSTTMPGIFIFLSSCIKDYEMLAN